MANRSHYNSGHRMLNLMNKTGKKHISDRDIGKPDKTKHLIAIDDCVNLLKEIPDNSVQLVLIDPPYNIDMANWDTFDNYIEWASKWLFEAERILTENGSFVIFGGIQFENEKSGDLLELMHYIRHHSNLKLVNLIIWNYKNGMGAHRFFANRHEEIAWYVKSKKYTFNLDAVRIPYDDKTKKTYLTDKRLNPATVEKGKNPTNVWEINRLNGNSKERVGHPTQKPVELIERLIKSLSNPNDVVLDFFAGSGVTTRVCIQEERHSVSVDLDPMLPTYLQRHIEKMGDLLYSYQLITEETEFNIHPVFTNK
ncbi:site-specific DNA-methyltransferase [Virgibacillus indicus]|uniref:Site-specific DNA-methyltransferase n=1 Tax=Virgibacillus indicus TaxID=2024554 RepID=A0A265NBA7_9BACI|nr:site-specific DNA-methyltransferase [Virgibacillus indicus]OZU89075.1 site-specific DNA-methyltransferase [Virgibacillus indicus]